MMWRGLQLVMASTAAIALAAQMAKFMAKMWKPEKAKKMKTPQSPEDTSNEVINIRNREINDVILFSDDNIVRQIKVPPNKDLNICESRELNCFKLIRYIKAARETMDVCMYLITSEEIADHIIRLGRKHVLVRIVVDSDMAFTTNSQIKKLKEFSFIQVQTNKKTLLMHHKFCIIDGPKAVNRKNKLKEQAEKLNIYAQSAKSALKNKKNTKPPKGFVMSGSLNWSTHAMITNYESVIVTSNTSIVDKFETEFDSLWEENDLDLK